MSRSPGLTGMPAAPSVTQPGLASNLIVKPVDEMVPAGQDALTIGFWTIARVLSAYKIVRMSVRGPLVPSGLVIVGPRLFPGSIAGRITLHARFAALGPWKVRFKTVGGRLTGLPMLHPAAFTVFGMEIPPVGIPVPVWIRSCTIRLSPARRLSLISEVCVTLLLALVESRNNKKAAARAIMVTASAIMISTSVNPVFFFIYLLLNPALRELRDIANENVLPRHGANGVGHGDGDHPKARRTNDVRDCDRPLHIRQGHHHIIRIAENFVRTRTHDYRDRKRRVVVNCAVEPINAGGEKGLRADEENTVIGAAGTGDVSNVRPDQQVGVARSENRLHCLFRLLFGD